jgi:hypothetical protein
VAIPTPSEGTPSPVTLVKQRPERPTGLNIVGADDLFAPLPPVEWMCRSLLLAPGAPTMFAGYGYSGKSIALQSLAMSVAGGIVLWGTFGVRRGRVLHLDYEQGRRITAERYQRMAFAAGLDPAGLSGQLDVGILPSVGLTADLLSRVADGRVLVVVDSWRAAHPGIDENSSDVRKTLDAMGVASERTGAMFVVLHHTRKPSKDAAGGSKMAIRGSSGFYDGCQTIYLFDGETVGRPTVTLEKDRISGQSMEPFVLVVEDTDDGAGLRVRHESMEEPVKEHPAETFAKTSALVVELLKRSPGMSASKLAEVTEKRKAHVLAVIQSLIAEGELVQVGKGPMTRLYTKGAQPEAPF